MNPETKYPITFFTLRVFAWILLSPLLAYVAACALIVVPFLWIINIAVNADFDPPWKWI
jgi:hypothetical protein